ncbi:MAG: glutathione ABC transporter ATP-binding protein [Candidatus Thermofonsia Clade 1 bacterium]|jgi:peptide/nickel transport system ATP-binding protein|uniref:Glutathione ABC transporter ATP-binding protein n=1 Tax=Candidatus Thermofonsia Clade 1 bacterium TaxID=2364210 RepID=A0A2M8PXM0_9CHLR|nr:MAG: glutathione ABC transporter ATP-binding protein [Candidatus Thermofonsia Clade 1 bacterium]
MESPILAIENLTVAYRLQGVWLDAVREVSLSVNAAQTYGIVGESGSGKSTLVQAVMGYLSANGAVRQGKIHFEGEDWLNAPRRRREQIWGARLSMVPQDPLSALNPALTIGEQIAELVRRHAHLSRRAAHARAVEMLQRVKLPDPEGVARRYPHQISGGQQQRALIAMALASPELRLLVLDEPTTSLDVTTEAAILDLFAELQDSHRAATLFVTHNLGVVARMCQRVAVLYAGEVMEDAPTITLYSMALHPYTRLLLRAVPRIGDPRPLQAIPGRIPSLRQRPSGCVFAPRCAAAIELCHAQKPPLERAVEGHLVRCHRWREIAAGSLRLEEASAELKRREMQQAEIAFFDQLFSGEQNGAQATVMRADHVRVQYGVRGLLGRLLGQKPPFRAVDDVSMRVLRGKTLGLVGESGSGKTTFARSLIGLIAIESGEAHLLDMPLRGRPRQRAKATLKAMQMIFQHPEESLNPYRTIGQTLRRPLMTLSGMSRAEANRAAAELLRAVSLPADYLSRFPSELSGGEKQRVAIARAFAAQPALILCDEPVSSLDVSVQAAILNLLAQLQQQHQVAYLLISHDLAVVSYLADYIAVIYRGQLVERGTAESFFMPPHHPYTEALLASIPLPDPKARMRRIRLTDDQPSNIVPSGCRFHPRCPRYLGDICRTQAPPWQRDRQGGYYRCHIPPDELAALQTEPEG